MRELSIMWRLVLRLDAMLQLLQLITITFLVPVPRVTTLMDLTTTSLVKVLVVIIHLVRTITFLVIEQVIILLAHITFYWELSLCMVQAQLQLRAPTTSLLVTVLDTTPPLGQTTTS